MERPRCAYCGKPAPKLTTTVWTRGLDSHRNTDGSWYRYIYLAEPLRSIAECRRHSNKDVVAVNYNHEKTVAWFSEWDASDGYWFKHRPCCSVACLQKFAKAAHAAGYRMAPAKEDA